MRQGLLLERLLTLHRPAAGGHQAAQTRASPGHYPEAISGAPLSYSLPVWPHRKNASVMPKLWGPLRCDVCERR